MKTNTERKNEIISKLRSLAELSKERSIIDFEMEKQLIRVTSIYTIKLFQID